LPPPPGYVPVADWRWFALEAFRTKTENTWALLRDVKFRFSFFAWLRLGRLKQKANLSEIYATSFRWCSTNRCGLSDGKREKIVYSRKKHIFSKTIQPTTRTSADYSDLYQRGPTNLDLRAVL